MIVAPLKAVRVKELVMEGTKKRQGKIEYFEKIHGLLRQYQKIFIVTADNVSSNQMHRIRMSLRDFGVVLFGKNTMMKRAIRGILQENPKLERLLPLIRGNVGFVFTNKDLKSVREKITSEVACAPARAGAVAPCDVMVPPGNTGMEPGKTSFFQALNIPTKIARGTIEIVSEIHLVHDGARVGASEAALLNMLNISPFTYGMNVVSIYDDGNVFQSSVLDVSPEQIINNVLEAARDLTAISLAVDYPTVLSAPHLLLNAFKDALSVSIATDYTTSYTEQVRFPYYFLPMSMELSIAST